ncbi:LacI family DNA-binding transcriptional regulator [Nostocoides sp. Soil756]|uniref:LacI family DNA-binding transcriptional regulator n=1 Tax=Nostocoides sp. Soil756 TaxID=1736399 RepID=UPI0006FD778A|nr:LacI family DNA-binding transcriptional regulator [Tetrasphaera sp. Soil756]KRE63130.1 transcriptional regulator,sugar-binding protein [Tetrasphaera sp. Soil756]
MPSQRQAEPRRATLRDVAERAGVSTSTASLVFSGKGPVAAATADRVRAAAADLGFTGPDPLASSLRQGRVGTVAVIVEGPLRHAFRDPFALAVLDGLAEELDLAGRTMLLVAQPVEHPEQAVAQLATQAVDAAVFPLCGTATNPLVEHLATRGVVMVGSGAPLSPEVGHVLTDERAGQRLAGQHLLDLGHRRLGHVSMMLRPAVATGPVTRADVEHADYPDAAGRARGFLDIAPEGSPMVQVGELTVGAGEEAGRLLLDVPVARRPTAVVCQADVLAAGVVRAAASLGLRVPDEVSVTGFDGVDLPWLGTTLTTVLQPGVAKGHALGAMVRRRLEGEGPVDEPFAVSLRVGTSTAPPPG